MDYQLEFAMFSLSALLLFVLIFISQTKSKSKEGEAPELDGAWPIIGHLHLFPGGDHLLHHTLAAFADKYGPAFNMRLGTRRAFVVSSWEVAKECLTVNDKALACRPKTAALKYMCYNNKVFGLGPYTPYWRAMKKITIQEFLSNRRIEMLRDVRLSEINLGLSDLYARWQRNSNQPVVVQLTNWMEHVMFNIIVIMVAGKRYFGDGAGGARFQKAISEFYRLSGAFVVSDVIPFLWWLDLRGYKKQMKRVAKDLDFVLHGWLDEHRRKRKLDLEQNKDEAKDFLDIMLSLEDEGKLPNNGFDSDTIIKSTCMGMILAGYTTAETVNWAISLLLNHPDVLKKLQHEIDNHVGKDRQVDEADIKNLVFLEAIIKETLRLYPAGPLLAPREAREDCTVAGYNVKAGTRLIVNVWKIQHDKRVWSDPLDFQPERFMGLDHQHIDLKGNHFVLLPFGSGRRSCPGSTLALLEIHLTLARLVHSFDLDRPEGLPVDMTEGPGMANPKKKPLEQSLVVIQTRVIPRDYLNPSNTLAALQQFTRSFSSLYPLISTVVNAGGDGDGEVVGFLLPPLQFIRKLFISPVIIKFVVISNEQLQLKATLQMERSMEDDCYPSKRRHISRENDVDDPESIKDPNTDEILSAEILSTEMVVRQGYAYNDGKECLMDEVKHDCFDVGQENNNSEVKIVMEESKLDSMEACSNQIKNEDKCCGDNGGSHFRKKLLVLDVNGLLVDIVADPDEAYKPDKIIGSKAVFKRPFCDEFLKFCFERFNVGVWTSRTRRNIERVLQFLAIDSKHQLAFCWDQSHCTDTGFNTIENSEKPLVLKELKKLWEKQDISLPWDIGMYNESNTIFLDDSPYKALRNPPCTAIFPHSYNYRNTQDNGLGPNGDLRNYLERLAASDNVQKFIEQNPFGQQPITYDDESWGFYSKIIGATDPKAGPSRSRRKLIVIDTGGFLVDVTTALREGFKADTMHGSNAVFKRPHCDEFLQFCFERFNVGVWTSTSRYNTECALDFLMGDNQHKLLFCWDRNHCSDTGFGTVENNSKALILKELRKLWEKKDPNLPWEIGEYDESNTLLIETTPHKALLNPPHTAIFLNPYRYWNTEDDSLGTSFNSNL
ncbi:hypothetical protein E3N88_10489 [Mikania micrantha]|uniref:FCP1 homology domain-containing protein n=1 Tax=Mikania micrantha TaxID=192012 RepID=A0A5N6PBS0_9ASTR|nr:hypothetical protein E3N88_10489 [Mikania micrantha]